MDDKISQSAGKRNPVHVKVEPVDNNMVETTVKVEPVDNNMVETTVKNEMGNLPNSSMVRVKTGVGITYEFTEDELDNMALSERLKLYSKKRAPSFKIGRVVEYSSEIAPSVSDCTPISAVPAKPLKVCPPRKQRKTATDSVQAAMEEDAPGLLRVLIEKGVSVDEMKLYGKNGSDEPLDDLSFEDNFSELQAVISKLHHPAASIEAESSGNKVPTKTTMNQGDDSSHLSFQLNSHKLNGKNYLEWAQSVLLAIDG